MSNEMTVFLQNNQSLLVSDGPLDEDTLAVAGSGNSKRISIKGGVFRKIVGGKEVATLEERYMNVIFVKMAHDPSRQYYANAFSEGDKTPPVCWSSDAKVPDAECPTPQSQKCDTCQFSVKGSGRDGKGSACRIAWRTAVVLPNDPHGDVLQLVLPAASVFGDEESGRWPFRSYVQMLAGHNISAGRVITKMSFDISAPSPRVLFNPISAVPPEDLSTVLSQAKSRDAENAVKLSVFIRDTQAAAEPAGAESAQPSPVTSVPAPAADSGNIRMPVEPGKLQSKSFGATIPPTAVTGAIMPEPVLRQPEVPAAKTETEVSDIVARWAKKGK